MRLTSWQRRSKRSGTVPRDATFAWSYKARALRTLGRHQEALDAAANIPKRFVVR